MKKPALIFLIFIILFNVKAKSQIDLFDQGIKYFQSGNYKLADSLFTLDIHKKSSPDTYFNRGVTRLYMKDTLGFCFDMRAANVKYSDKEAVSLYDNICCKSVDTIYFDKRYTQTTKGKHKFFEVIKQIKQSDQIYGEIHNIHAIYSKYNTDMNSNSFHLNELNTDIFATYILKDSSKIYLQTLNPPNDQTLRDVDFSIDESFRSYLSTKYKWFLERNGLSDITILFSFIVNTSGKIEELKIEDVHSNTDINEIKDNLLKDAKDELLKRKYKPGLFRGEKVPFSILFFVRINKK